MSPGFIGNTPRLQLFAPSVDGRSDSEKIKRSVSDLNRRPPVMYFIGLEHYKATWSGSGHSTNWANAPKKQKQKGMPGATPAMCLLRFNKLRYLRLPSRSAPDIVFTCASPVVWVTKDKGFLLLPFQSPQLSHLCPKKQKQTPINANHRSANTMILSKIGR